MKIRILFFIGLFHIICGMSFAQRVYVDIQECSSTITNETKLGWAMGGDPVFQDEFNFTTSDPLVIDFPPGITCPSLPYSDIYKVVQSDQFWRWRFDPNTYSGEEPHYYSLDNITATAPVKYLTLQINSYPGGYSFGDPEQYPVHKCYSSSTIMTQSLGKCKDGGVDVYAGAEYTYGWFEIRCKLPQKKHAWPGFWLSGAPGA